MLELLTFAWINLLGVMSPGPDFAIVTRYGFAGSRKAAFHVTLGIVTALLIHVFYSLFGIALFLQSSPFAFKILQTIGALYLGYLGIKLVRVPLHPISPSSPKQQSIHKGAFTAGFLTNLLNPKCTLFTLSLFSQFVAPTTSFSQKLLFGLLVPITALCWFGLLSYLLTHPKFLPRIERFQGHFTRLMGAFLILLSLSILIKSY